MIGNKQTTKHQLLPFGLYLKARQTSQLSWYPRWLLLLGKDLLVIQQIYWRFGGGLSIKSGFHATEKLPPLLACASLIKKNALCTWHMSVICSPYYYFLCSGFNLWKVSRWEAKKQQHTTVAHELQNLFSHHMLTLPPANLYIIQTGSAPST